jgi:hypothetical protein
MTDADRQLDDDLRRVPLPADLRAALTPESLFAEATIDRLLAAVAVPPGLAERVQAAARASDAPARNGMVDLSRFADRPERAPLERQAAGGSSRRPRGRLMMVREAGRVAAALGLAFVLATAGMRLSRWLEGPDGAELTARRTESGSRTAASPQRATAGPTDAFAAAERGDGRTRDGGDRMSRRSGSEQDVATVSPVAPALPAPEDVAEVSAAAPQAVSLAAGERQVRGAPIPLDEALALAGMTVVELPRDARRQVPKSTAFDMAFELAHGESPFVSPAADPSLAVDRPPLTLGTNGFDRLVGATAGRRAPGFAPRIRAEELLAAMPPPPDVAAPGPEPVRLGFAAVRSGRTLGGKPTVFLEAAAFAAGLPRGDAAPLRTTLILDQAAAGDPQAWPRICRALGAVAARLEPDDRVGVVLCGPRPRVVLRDAAAADIAAAALNLEALPAAVSCDLDAAVDAAREAGLLAGRTVVVAHGATLDRCRGEVQESLSAWHRGLALTGGDPVTSGPPDGIRFVVLDAATQPPDRDAGPSFGRTSLDAVAIRRDLLRQVLGQDTLVARQCSLEIRFDPDRVAAYRLVGHRQSVVESLADAPPATIDLHAGETVRVVYEVVPKQPGATGLASARLSWRTPAGSAARLDAADRVSSDRTAALPSPHGCELVLAATLGDLAGGSVHTSQPRAALAALHSVADRWQVRGDVTPFGTTLIRVIDRQIVGPRGGR